MERQRGNDKEAASRRQQNLVLDMGPSLGGAGRHEFLLGRATRSDLLLMPEALNDGRWMDHGPWMMDDGY